MSTTDDLFEGVFDNRATQRREIWQAGRLCRYVRRECTGHTGSVWKEVHAAWGSYPDLPSNAAKAHAA